MSTGTAPLLAIGWESDRLDPRAIANALQNLWGDLHARIGSATDLRASTINLITVTDQADRIAGIEASLLELQGFSPSRVIMLHLDREARPGTFAIEVTLRELPAEKSRAYAHFEQVKITAPPALAVSLASIASPLLLPELPTYLYWPGSTLVESPLFEELIEITDRLVIDSSLFTDPESNLRALSILISRHRAPIVGDFAWQRLTPWRLLLAQFFDHPDALNELDKIEEVELIGRLAGKSGQSGMTANLLIAGWLAASLNWRPPGPMVRAKDGWRVTLRSGSGASEREIVFRLRLKQASRSPGRVLSVMMRSDDGDPMPALFRIERVSGDQIHTYSEFGGHPPMTRGVPAPVFTDSALLGRELATLGRDSMYEHALLSAIALMPEE
jgi:glucose-6-phosphate dehydrogenase assembly protein OpcA